MKSLNVKCIITVGFLKSKQKAVYMKKIHFNLEKWIYNQKKKPMEAFST